MESYKNLAWPLYLTGLVIIGFPALEFFLTILPLSPSILSWRFGAMGLLARSILIPLLGLALIYGTAVVLNHVWMLRVVAIVALVGAVLLLPAMGLFALDMLQLRNEVRAEASAAYDASSVVALMRLFACCVVLVAFGLSSWKNARRKGGKKDRKSGPSALVSSRGTSQKGAAAEAGEIQSSSDAAGSAS
jgi:hypothetical protein